MNLTAALPLSQLYMGCEYQGLVCPFTLKVKGYEALARFKTPEGDSLAPNLVFEWLHDHPELFEQVEYQAKRFQLKNAPRNTPLFVNLDPHAISTQACEPLLECFKAHGNLTIELIENTCINDATLASHLLKKLSKLNIDVALDDVGAPHSMLSLDLLSQVQCIKFDRAWLLQHEQSHSGNNIEIEPERKALLISLIAYAKQTGKLCILEGIETQEQLELAKELNLDRVQGFLFKDQFIQTEINTKVSIPISTTDSYSYQLLMD